MTLYVSKQELNEMHIPGPRHELRSYQRHMRRSYYPGMRRKYTVSCLTGWVQRVTRQLQSIAHGEGRIMFAFAIADTDAAFFCHEPYEPWDLEKYMPDWAKGDES